MEKAKRERSSNFSSQELQVLVDLAANYRDIIECKKNDAATWKEKDTAWRKLAWEFNSKAGVAYRTEKHLRTKFESIKKEVRKKTTKLGPDLFKAHNGVITIPPLTPMEEKVKNLMAMVQSRSPDTNDGSMDDEREARATGSQSHGSVWEGWNPANLSTPLHASHHDEGGLVPEQLIEVQMNDESCSPNDRLPTTERGLTQCGVTSSLQNNDGAETPSGFFKRKRLNNSKEKGQNHTLKQFARKKTELIDLQIQQLYGKTAARALKLEILREKAVQAKFETKQAELKTQLMEIELLEKKRAMKNYTVL